MNMPVVLPLNETAQRNRAVPSGADLANHKTLVVANRDEVHVGRHLLAAAKQLQNWAELADVKNAFQARSLVQKILWRWDRRPIYLRRFSRQVVDICTQFRPDIVVTTGVCPLGVKALKSIRSMGTSIVNFLTDDPFNPTHRAAWFIDSLPHYNIVFSPRRANISNLNCAGCADVPYLPFAYSPDQHFRESHPLGNTCDVLFVGGADNDRVPMLVSLIESGLDVALYGGYWDRNALTRPADRGLASATQIRRATTAAKVCLILVRRANRDGHVMRSFEAAACGGCLLVEDTAEHRDIFADTVTYFRTADEMVEQAQRLLTDSELRQRSAEASYRRIVTEGQNTYSDRLHTILTTSLRS